MANTTNYNWETPDDTDLVKDGAAAIRTLGSSVDTTTKALNPSTTLGDIEYRSATANTNTRLGIGSTGQVLTVAGGVPTWATSDDANAIQNAIVDAKGDIVAASAADTPARLAVGTDNQRLVAASGEATGLKYVSDTQNTVIDAEGDLLVGDAADALQRLAIGSNAQVLTVDTSIDGKIKWATPAAGGGGLIKISTNTFSASSTVNINSIFSATYKKYKLILQFTASTDDFDLTLRLRASSTDTTTNYKSLTNWYTATQDVVEVATTSFMGVRAAGSARNAAEIVLINPFESTSTNIISMAYGSGIPASNNGYGSNVRGIQTGSTSFDGISLIPGAGNITGTCTIYGFEE